MKSVFNLIITILSLGLVISTLSINDVFSKPVKVGEQCYTDGRKDSAGNYITTCCYGSYEDGGTKSPNDDKFQGRFCEDCVIHDGGDVIICDDPYKESSKDQGNIIPHLNDNVIDQPLTAEEEQPPSFTNNRDSIIGDRLSDSELEKAQPSESQDNDLSTSEGIVTDSTNLASSNTLQGGDDTNTEGNNDNSSQ
jgi:hypothetical protein